MIKKLTIFLMIAVNSLAVLGKESLRVQVEPYGTLESGETVQQYRMLNRHGASVAIIDYGAIITHIIVPDGTGTMADVVLGYDNLQSYVSDGSYLGAVVGRYANRIAKGKFQLNGRDYRLDKNNHENHLHGGIEGFNKKLWSAAVNQQDSFAEVTMKLLSPDGDQGYPGEVNAAVTYRFDDNSQLSVSFEATSSEATIINLSQHSYFNLNGHDSGSVESHTLWMDADRYTPVTESLIPTGVLETVEDSPFDFTKPKKIGRDIGKENTQLSYGNGYDHNFVFSSYTGSSVRHRATVISGAHGRTMELHTDQPGVQLYSANHLDGSTLGKGGAAYGFRQGFCLESQHFPDSPNQLNFPSVVLNPGEVYKTTTVFKFGVLD